jgi:hypothetical protein
LKLVWLGCGNRDGLIRISQAVHQYLKENGVAHIWHVDGNAHDTIEWDNNLYLFSQHIFRSGLQAMAQPPQGGAWGPWGAAAGGDRQDSAGRGFQTLRAERVSQRADAAVS